MLQYYNITMSSVIQKVSLYSVGGPLFLIAAFRTLLQILFCVFSHLFQLVLLFLGLHLELYRCFHQTSCLQYHSYIPIHSSIIKSFFMTTYSLQTSLLILFSIFLDIVLLSMVFVSLMFLICSLFVLIVSFLLLIDRTDVQR